jgi:cold shock protein
VTFGTVKHWNDDEGWGALISPEVSGEVWVHFSHIVGDDVGYRSLSDGERVRFRYERTGQDGFFWRATWVVGLSGHSEYAALTEEEIADRLRRIDERRGASCDQGTYLISETIEVVDAPAADDDAPRTT